MESAPNTTIATCRHAGLTVFAATLLLLLGAATTVASPVSDRGGVAARHHGSVTRLRDALRLVIEATIPVRYAHLSAPTVCSHATPQGQVTIIELIRGQLGYLPSMTCEDAVAERPEIVPSFACTSGDYAYEVEKLVKGARINKEGSRATIQLATNGTVDECHGELANGAVSHWTEAHGQWLFNNKPTGTYSPEGKKAAALLRTALTGGTITETIALAGSGNLSEMVAFCANGSSKVTVSTGTVTGTEPGSTWSVAGGYEVTTHKPGRPFNSQGDPEGVVIGSAYEWGVMLVGDKIVLSQPTAPPGGIQHTGTLTFQPGTAGC